MKNQPEEPQVVKDILGMLRREGRTPPLEGASISELINNMERNIKVKELK